MPTQTTIAGSEADAHRRSAPEWSGFAPGGFGALSEQDFEGLLASSPEIVLLGSGATQRFPHPGAFAPLMRARVGVEVMDTRAACRTYNILIAEGRNVVAALIVE